MGAALRIMNTYSPLTFIQEGSPQGRASMMPTTAPPKLIWPLVSGCLSLPALLTAGCGSSTSAAQGSSGECFHPRLIRTIRSAQVAPSEQEMKLSHQGNCSDPEASRGCYPQKRGLLHQTPSSGYSCIKNPTDCPLGRWMIHTDLR